MRQRSLHENLKLLHCGSIDLLWQDFARVSDTLKCSAMNTNSCRQSLSASVIAILFLGNVAAQGEDWAQWRGSNRDAVINDPEIAQQLPEGELPRLWDVSVGPGYSGPTVASGRVYLTDRQGEEDQASERVLCMDAKTGDTLWKHEYPVEYSIGYQASGPRAAVTVDDDLAFAVGGMGMMHCLTADEGQVVWKRDLSADYKIRMPIWGITASPIVYQQSVIQVVAGAGDACLVAFDRQTGRELWRAIDEKAGYSAPILIRQGDADVLVCWTGESITGLDPSDGDVYWSVEMKPRNMPIGVPTPVVNGNKLFVSSFYDGSMMIELDEKTPNAKKLWHRIGVDEKNTDALHSMISNPILRSDAVYGVDSYGQFRCLDIETGDRIWENNTVVPRARWATVHMIQNGQQIIMVNERGELLLSTLSTDGVEIQSRSRLIDPTLQQLRRRDGVVWSHPALANGVIFARNDKQLVAVSLHR